MGAETDEVDWRLLLDKILQCFSDREGTWFESSWQEFGITAQERAAILELPAAVRASRE